MKGRIAVRTSRCWRKEMHVGELPDILARRDSQSPAPAQRLWLRVGAAPQSSAGMGARPISMQPPYGGARPLRPRGCVIARAP
jgi:hypothetical protein